MSLKYFHTRHFGNGDKKELAQKLTDCETFGYKWKTNSKILMYITTLMLSSVYTSSDNTQVIG